MNNIINQEEKDRIDTLCNLYGIKNYTINGDGSIDVDGDVIMYPSNLNRLPLVFNKVSGNFNCYNNLLTSMKGCPTELGGGFYCSSNKLTSLEHCPVTVSGHFNCGDNQLTSLKGCPIKIGGDFDCSGNELLTSLEFLPTDVGCATTFEMCSLPDEFEE